MPVETGILRGDGRMDQVKGQFVVADESTVFDMVSGQDLAFLGDDLGSELALRVLQFFDGRNLGEGPYDSQQDDDEGDGGEEEDPEPADDLLAGIL